MEGDVRKHRIPLPRYWGTRVDPRAFNVAVINVGAPTSPVFKEVTSDRAACWPIAKMSKVAVVNGGSVSRHKGESSHPTIATSSGTFFPAERTACKPATAITSLSKINAVGAGLTLTPQW